MTRRFGFRESGIKESWNDLPGCKTFFFRVRFINKKGTHTFDTAIVHYRTLNDAYVAVKRCYPGAEISAIQENEFDADGLPKLTIRGHAGATA